MTTTSRLQVRESRSDEESYQFLAQDRPWGGYAICDLEPGPRERSHYWVACRSAEVVALCLLFRMRDVCSLHTFGEAAGVGALLHDMADSPDHAYVLIREQHLEAIRSRYEMKWPDRMYRMLATRETFSPLASLARRLEPRQAPAVAELYATPRGRSVRAQAMLAQTCYGVWQEGRLVSIAGTHGLSRQRGMAAIGNVFTHPAYRGRGYAKMCVGALTADLLRTVPEIILNVNARNAPALRVYGRVGFRPHCSYYEGRAVLLPEHARRGEAPATTTAEPSAAELASRGR
jgi:RimJ/RimL family protein N-acetyltransferase